MIRARRSYAGRGTLQIVPELRNYHLDLLTDDVISLLYFAEKYDLEESRPVDPRVRRVSPLQAARIALTARASSLDLFEPLWVRNFVWWILIASAWKVGHLRAGHAVVIYCMENNSPTELVSGNRTPLPGAARAFAFFVGRLISLLCTRLAFASPGSRATYESLKLSPHVERRVFVSLPAADGRAFRVQKRAEITFVGRLEDRKGIDNLMAAWEQIEVSYPSAILNIIGDGPRERDVAQWASEGKSRRFRGAMEHSAVRDQLLESKIVVLPSIRYGRWREQIGLPILEGLAAGCVIVSSDESGLAEWLARNGHQVYPASSVPDLSAAISRALHDQRDSHDILRSLPTRSTRGEAVAWLRR